MSYVEPASADPTVCASRTQTPLANGARKADSPSPTAEDFASLFASTRQSLTWLNGLFDRRADQIAACQRRQQRVTDALNHRGRNGSPERASYSEPGQSVTRTEQLRESVHDHTQSTDRTANAQHDRQVANDYGRADRRAVDESKFDTSRYPQQPEAPVHPRMQEPETNELETQQYAQDSTEQETAAPVSSAGAEGVNSAGAVTLSSPSSNANSQMPITLPNVRGPEMLTAQVQVSASVQNVHSTMTANMAKGVTMGTGVSQDSLQVSTTARGAEGSVKPGIVTLDFQTILTHVGKSQSAGSVLSNGLSAMGDKQAMGETVKLAGPESVQELARVVRSNLTGRNASMVLRLDPPELGQMRVDVKMHDQVLLLRFQAETQAGQDALQTRLTDLRAALEQHGIQLDHVEVEFRPPVAPNSDGSQTDHRQYHQGASGGDSFFGHAQGHNGSANESFSSSDFTGPPGQMQPETLPAGNNELMDDDVARPAETGVDLIV